MPRYYFDLSGDLDRPDPAGTELIDLASARHEAFLRGATLLSAHDASRPFNEDWRLDVTDEHGFVLFRLDVTTDTIPTCSDQDG